MTTINYLITCQSKSKVFTVDEVTSMARSNDLVPVLDQISRSVQTKRPRPINEFSSPFIMAATSKFFRIILYSPYFKHESTFDLASYGISNETQKILRFIIETGQPPVGYSDSLLRQLNIAMDMLLVFDP